MQRQYLVHTVLKIILIIIVSFTLIGGLTSICSAFKIPGIPIEIPVEIPDAGEIIAENTILCGGTGAAAAKILGSDKVREIAAAGLITCSLITLELDKQRKAILDREEDIDRRIEQELMRISELERMNDDLRKEIRGIEQKVNELKVTVQTDKAEAFKLAAILQNDQENSQKRLITIDQTILKAEKKLRSASRSKYQESELPGLLPLLKARRELFLERSEININLQ